MTPECPKGPERDEHPVSWTTYLRTCEALDQARTSAATWQMRAEQAEPEVERLTAEVALYRERDGLTRKALQHDGDGPLQFAALIVRQQRDKALAEVSRLTTEVEQLRKRGETQAAIIDGWVRYGRRTNDQKREWRAEVSRLREQLAPAKLSAAVHQERADQLHIGLRRLLDRDREIENGPAPIDPGESGVSSSEVEAPQPRHIVTVEPREGMFYAECTVCHDGTHSSDQKVMEDWKDQHEADTLRPVLTNESFISSQSTVCTAEHPEFGRCFIDADEHTAPGGQDYHESEEGSWPLEGRPSGSGAAEPHSEPTFSVDDMMASGWETAVAQGERDLLLKMAGELLEQCTDWDDQYGTCAESVPDPACRIRAIVNRYAIQQDAAQAARSEATLHRRAWRDSSGDLWAELPDLRRAVFLVEYKGQPYEGSVTLLSNVRETYGPLTEVPSPSLRKEGGDSD